jgi:hypothetical protein
MSSPDGLMLQPVAWDFVSRVGSVRKTNGRCRHANCLNGGVHPTVNVDDFVKVRTSSFNTDQ